MSVLWSGRIFKYFYHDLRKRIAEAQSKHDTRQVFPFDKGLRSPPPTPIVRDDDGVIANDLVSARKCFQNRICSLFIIKW